MFRRERRRNEFQFGGWDRAECKAIFPVEGEIRHLAGVDFDPELLDFVIVSQRNFINPGWQVAQRHVLIVVRIGVGRATAVCPHSAQRFSCRFGRISTLYRRSSSPFSSVIRPTSTPQPWGGDIHNSGLSVSWKEFPPSRTSKCRCDRWSGLYRLRSRSHHLCLPIGHMRR